MLSYNSKLYKKNRRTQRKWRIYSYVGYWDACQWEIIKNECTAVLTSEYWDKVMADVTYESYLYVNQEVVVCGLLVDTEIIHVVKNRYTDSSDWNGKRGIKKNM